MSSVFGPHALINNTGVGKKALARLRECYRQAQAEVVSNSRIKFHQTWGPSFCLSASRRTCDLKSCPVQSSSLPFSPLDKMVRRRREQSRSRWEEGEGRGDSFGKWERRRFNLKVQLRSLRDGQIRERERELPSLAKEQIINPSTELTTKAILDNREFPSPGPTGNFCQRRYFNEGIY